MALVVEAAVVAGDSGVAVALSRADAPATAAPRSTALGPAQAQDLPSARLMAQLQHRQIEALGERTDASQTFVNADGTVTYTAFAQPKWTKRQGSWVDLDATLQLRSDGTVTPVAAETGLVLSGGGSKALATMEVDGKSISLTWPSTLPAPSLSGATAIYAGVLDGVDLHVTADPRGGVEETLVVKTAAAASNPGLTDLAQAVSTSNGVTAVTDSGGNMTIKDSAGRLLVNSPAPLMWDSATVPGATSTPTSETSSGVTAPAHGADAKTQPSAGSRSSAEGPGSLAHQAPVKATLKDHKLHLVADRSLLSAKSTVFPVYIDPAYVPHPASGSTLHWNEVQQAYATTSNYDSTPSGGNGVGYQGFSAPTGIERTYYRVSIPSAIWGGTVLSADMKLTESKSSDCSSSSYAVQAWSTNGFDSSTNWTNAPGKVTQQSSVNFGPACNGATVPGTFSFMNQVGNAAANHWQNISFVLINSSETNDAQLKRFSSAASLSITYNTPPGTPTALSASPSATAGYAASGTPVLSAKSTDANSDTVRLDYQILSGTTVKASGSSAFVGSGTAATWKPGTALSDGAYTWKIRAYDGHDYSAWTAAQPLTIDTKAPSTTAVASSDFPANAWSGTADAAGDFSGTFTFTPPTTDVGSVVWNLDGGAAHTHATTGSAVSDTITFRAGKHTLSTTAHDKAGNISAATSYVFYAGSGAALLTPAEGDRPARRVSLTGQGKTTETGVTYQYRVGDTDTWHAVPAADVRQSDGSTLTAWPFPASGGLPAGLTWDITTTLAQDGPVDVRAVFTDGSTSDNSPANTVIVDRNAGSAPSLSVGPASVNALTGEASISATDASGFDMTVTRTASSRRPANGTAQEGQVAIFGPQWTAGTTAEITDSDWSYLHKTSNTSVALVDVDGDPTGFTAVTGGGWKPELGAEDLSLTGSLTGTFTLKDDDGTTTTFAKVDPSATAWQVTSTFLPTTNSTTQVVSEKVTSGSTILARPKYVIAPTSAAAQSTCAATPATKGCRVLEYVYATATTATTSAFGNYTGQVSQVRLWATAPGAPASTAVAVAQYAYDTTGKLRQEWDPRINPELKTAYAYDSAGRITTLTPPGELPWTLAYSIVGSAPTAGDGMLVEASRPTLTPGSASQTDGGKAITSVVYNVPLTGGSAPYYMDTTDVADWGQTDVPTDATAVFPPDHQPPSHNGAQNYWGAYERATITYTDASGREVNTIAPGGYLTTSEYDRFGNTVRQLSASNLDLALATDGSGLAEQQRLGIDSMSSADRAQLLSTTSVYNSDSIAADAGTDKDTDPANVGQRELEELGPLHMVTLARPLPAGAGGTDLPAGSSVPARQHTVTSYDQGRPNDGTATVANQSTTVTIGASVDGYPTDGDVRTSTTRYDWAKGLSNQTVTDPAGLDLVRTTAYDAQGRVVKTTLPMSSGSDAGATVTTYWSASGTGTCNGRPEWADLVCSVGPAGAITGGGTNPTQLPTTTTTYDLWGNTAAVTEAANGITRTTTTSHDDAGRDTGTTVTGGTGTAVPDTVTTYDPATGKDATTSAGGQTITHTYDNLGREITYNDGNGNTTKTSYDELDRPIMSGDSAPSTTTYTYDTDQDPRGLETSRTDSAAGTFTASYDSDGEVADETLPGGYSLTVTRDETGAETSRVYTRDSDGTVIASDATDESVHGQVLDDADTAGQTHARTYTYDAAGRLTQTDDTAADDTCTRRTYGFDPNSNRTSLATSISAPGAACDSTGATTTTTPYDSADRLQTTGTVYDALGRTTTQASNASIGYYTNDLVRQQTSADGTNRQTWTLDAAQRLASWTTETNSTGAWTQTATKTNHYGSDSDSPDWTAEDAAGTVTRDVQGIDGGLDATTATGGTVLQMTDVHGDATVQLPLDPTVAPMALAYDEFGNPEDGTTAARYGWLGGKQRSSETPTGAILMGVRLYDTVTGRFLSLDPISGGSANAYDYCNADPISCYDLDGQFPHPHWHNPFHVDRFNPLHHWGSSAKHAWGWTSRHANRTWPWISRRTRHYARKAWNWGRSVSRNHYFRACVGIGAGAGIPAWKTATEKALRAGVWAFVGACVASMIYVEWN